MKDADTPNLKSFNAHADENGQMMGQDSPLDVGNAARLRQALDSDPSGEAETARLASGHSGEGHDEATAAETPEATKRLGDASLGGPGSSPASREAVERATAGLGKPE
jgi:hypothetical protein